jgi:hypothetical protein
LAGAAEFEGQQILQNCKLSQKLGKNLTFLIKN